MRVESIEPDDAEAIVDSWRQMTAYSARRCVFEDGEEVVVIIYSVGPTANHKAVEQVLDNHDGR